MFCYCFDCRIGLFKGSQQELYNMQPIDIIDYWYSERLQKQWFAATPELDNEIKESYEPLWQQAAKGELDQWIDSAEGCLALVIILDQFPLNMFRGQAKSFQTEAKSIEVTKIALEKGFDLELDKDKLSFLLMPLMHSEKLEDQDLSVKFIKVHDLNNSLKFAEHHRGLIQKFGRFPHRNAILGRESSQAEKDYLNSKEAFTG